MGFSVLTRLIAFLFKVYLSRAAGAEALGLFSMGLSMFSLLSMLPSSGIPLTVSRRVAEYDALGTPHQGHRVITTGLIVTLLVNVATVGIFLLFRRPLLSLFADNRAEKVILIMLPATFSTCIYNVLRAFFMGRKHYVLFSVTELVEEILNVVAVLLLLSGWFIVVDGASALAIAFTVCDVLCFILIVILYFCNRGRLARPAPVVPFVKSSTPITLMRLFTSLAGTFTAILLPNRMVAGGMDIAQATAQYGRAVGMGFPLLFAPLAITSALSVVLLPEIAQLATTRQHAQIAQKVDTASWFILLITSLFYIVYASLGQQLGVILFADAEAGDFVSFSAALVLPLCLNQLTNTTMNSLAQEFRCFVNNMIALAVMVVALWFLPGIIGIYALSVAQTAFYLLSYALNAFCLVKLRATNMSFTKPFIKVAIGAIVITAAVVAFRMWLTPYMPTLWLTIVCGLLAVLLYLLLLIITKALDFKTIFLLVRAKFSGSAVGPSSSRTTRRKGNKRNERRHTRASAVCSAKCRRHT